MKTRGGYWLLTLCALAGTIVASYVHAQPMGGGFQLFLPRPGSARPPDRTTFSHKRHIDEGVECRDCHGSVVEATTIEGTVLPKMEFCFECHEDRKGDCAMCHTNPDDPQVTFHSLVTTVRFSHKAHLARENVTCLTCHPAAPESTKMEDRLVPYHPQCITCHGGDYDRLSCSKCHIRLEKLGRTPKDEAIHKVGFVAFHGAWARGTSALCSQCHEPTFCGDCHARTTPVRPSIVMPDAVDRVFMHRGDFLGRHALEASAMPARCLTCHGSSFCQDCHQKRGLAPNGDSASTLESPHPAGYVRRGGAFHGTDARLRIHTCAACHDQGSASICVGCHREGGIGGNPHPPGWNRRERDEDRRSSGTCIPCHNPALP